MCSIVARLKCDPGAGAAQVRAKNRKLRKLWGLYQAEKRRLNEEADACAAEKEEMLEEARART